MSYVTMSSEATAWLIVGLGILVLLIVVNRWNRGLSKKVAALEPLQGRPISEVTAALGPPRARVVAPDGTSVLTWNTDLYEVGLRFDSEGRCMGLAHEARTD